MNDAVIYDTVADFTITDPDSQCIARCAQYTIGDRDQLADPIAFFAPVSISTDCNTIIPAFDLTIMNHYIPAAINIKTISVRSPEIISDQNMADMNIRTIIEETCPVGRMKQFGILNSDS